MVGHKICYYGETWLNYPYIALNKLVPKKYIIVKYELNCHIRAVNLIRLNEIHGPQ